MKNNHIFLFINIISFSAMLISCGGSKQKIDLSMINVPAGSFMMGDTAGNWDEMPVHQVNISNSFLISETEVTTALFKHFKKDHPFTDEKYAIGVSWYEANEFCKWLSKKEGKNYRLPTEAEWEYVCGIRKELGIKNMLDSTLEWCSDWHGTYLDTVQTDPAGVEYGMAKVIRGGLPDDFIKEYSHKEEFYHRKSNRSGMAPGFDGYTVPIEFNEREGLGEVNPSELKGLAGLIYDDTNLSNPLMLFPIPNVNSTDYKWISMNDFSAKWQGVLVAPFSGIINIEVVCDNTVEIDISGENFMKGADSENSIAGTISGVQGEQYPIRIKYIHDGGPSYLKLLWSWEGQEEQVIPQSAFAHSNKEKIETETEYKRGVFKRYVNPSVGFRVVLANAPAGKPTLYEAPFIQQCIKEQGVHLQSRPENPYFRKRFLHPIPPDKTSKEEIIMSGLHSSLGGHNHHSAPVVCPNGDILTVYFSATFEDDPEVCLMASRLRYGSDEWDMPTTLIDFPDVNDVSALFWRNGNRICLFWGNIHLKGGYPFQWIESTDNGTTFSEVKFPVIESVVDGYTPQPITSVFKDTDGTIYLAADGVGAHSFLWASKDGGLTWYDTGGRTGGRHTAVIPLKNGDFYGVGGKKSDIDGFMPISISSDKGESWQVSKSIFPALGGGQRPALIRLKSGRLLYAGDYQHKDGQQPEGITEKGAFVALSDDEGETWHIKKIPGTHKSVKDKTLKTMNAGTLGYASLVQSENQMIHLTTSENAPALHFEFNEAWILNNATNSNEEAVLMNSFATHIPNVEAFEKRHTDNNLQAMYSGGVSNDGRFLLDGKEKWFYSGGNVKYEAEYKLGKKVGSEQYYSRDGVLLWERKFKDEGFTWRQYFDNGKIRSESHWESMKCNGIAKKWDRNGNLVSNLTFKEGHIIE